MNIAAILTLNVNKDMLQMWPLYNNTGNNTIQRFRSPELIRSDVWPQTETFLSGVLMIYENKKGNHLLYLVCYITWNYMSK